MNEILLTNLFFIIVGSVVVLLGIFWAVILIQVIKILRTARSIENKFHEIINKFVK